MWRLTTRWPSQPGRWALPAPRHTLQRCSDSPMPAQGQAVNDPASDRRAGLCNGSSSAHLSPVPMRYHASNPQPNWCVSCVHSRGPRQRRGGAPLLGLLRCRTFPRTAAALAAACVTPPAPTCRWPPSLKVHGGPTSSLDVSLGSSRKHGVNAAVLDAQPSDVACQRISGRISKAHHVISANPCACRAWRGRHAQFHPCATARPAIT